MCGRLVFGRCPVGVRSVSGWCPVGVRLASGCCPVGVRLVRCAVGVGLVGVRLESSWCPVSVRSVSGFDFYSPALIPTSLALMLIARLSVLWPGFNSYFPALIPTPRLLLFFTRALARSPLLQCLLRAHSRPHLRPAFWHSRPLASSMSSHKK